VAVQTHVKMRARPIDEPHRASSCLELLFDLTFVVAVASITEQLAHALADAHAIAGITPFLQVFFAIWWAWMNFTWFASSYDTDDVTYRLLTAVQMAGVLVLAAGVPTAFNNNDYRAVTLGYLIMRTGLVALWLRAAFEDAATRTTALRYAGGIAILEVAWVIRLLLAEAGVLTASWQLPVFVGLAVLELTVPFWSEQKRPTNWHPRHIAERYGLFAIILLGESVLAASRGVQSTLSAAGVGGSFVVVSVAGLVLLFALWWIYFLEPAGEGLASNRGGSWLWGYGHYGVFAALAALGAGLEVAVEQAGHHIAASPIDVGYAVAVPVAAFLTLLWAVHLSIVARPVIPARAMLGGALIIILLPLLSEPAGIPFVVASIATVCALIIVATIALRADKRARSSVAHPNIGQGSEAATNDS
jgi:low temperature requirement protein LtrA